MFHRDFRDLRCISNYRLCSLCSDGAAPVCSVYCRAERSLILEGFDDGNPENESMTRGADDEKYIFLAESSVLCA